MHGNTKTKVKWGRNNSFLKGKTLSPAQLEIVSNVERSGALLCMLLFIYIENIPQVHQNLCWQNLAAGSSWSFPFIQQKVASPWAILLQGTKFCLQEMAGVFFNKFFHKKFHISVKTNPRNSLIEPPSPPDAGHSGAGVGAGFSTCKNGISEGAVWLFHFVQMRPWSQDGPLAREWLLGNSWTGWGSIALRAPTTRAHSTPPEPGPLLQRNSGMDVQDPGAGHAWDVLSGARVHHTHSPSPGCECCVSRA